MDPSPLHFLLWKAFSEDVLLPFPPRLRPGVGCSQGIDEDTSVDISVVCPPWLPVSHDVLSAAILSSALPVAPRLRSVLPRMHTMAARKSI